MEIFEGMKTRRSIRSFKSDMLPDDMIERIALAGTQAASGRNLQSAIIVAVTDKETRDKLSAVNAQIMDRDGDPFYGAPVVLVVLADKSRSTCVYDGSLVMGNLMLAAHAEGIGSCWIHRAKETFERPEWKEWLKSVGVEGEYEGIGNCVLGYIDGDYPEDKPRNDGRVFWVK
jgi:nitroreductase